MIKLISCRQDAAKAMEFYPEEWGDFPCASDNYIILGSWSEGDLVGCFPVNFIDGEAEIHVAFHPDYRGSNAVDEAHKAFDWIFGNTGCNRIFATIEEEHVARYAERCGMVKSGNEYEVLRWADL